jgi:hypothetical protein
MGGGHHTELQVKKKYMAGQKDDGPEEKAETQTPDVPTTTNKKT